MINALKRAMTPFLLDGRSLSRPLINGFHRLYYASETWRRNSFLGYPIMQCPMDLQIYQELIFRLRPEVIIQTGIAQGGSLLYFASMLDLAGVADARVIGIDIELSARARTLTHPRICILEGNSTDRGIVDDIPRLAGFRNGMVVLDSDHRQDHVAAELELYSPLVGVGSYLVVEDTNINGHPVYSSFGPGPFEATKAFLANTKNFVHDDEIWRKNLFSMHTWLRRQS